MIYSGRKESSHIFIYVLEYLIFYNFLDISFSDTLPGQLFQQPVPELGTNWLGPGGRIHKTLFFCNLQKGPTIMTIMTDDCRTTDQVGWLK